MSKLVRPTPKPRVFWSAKPVSNDAEDAIFLASAYQMAPDDWQVPILQSWLGRKRNGKWCHGRCGIAIPRQNGKNGVIEIRELFGMIVLGEAILHTAHEVKTARKAFKRLKHFFGEKANDPDARFPELNDLVAEVRNTNGQEAIILKDVFGDDGAFVRRGGSVEFVARSNGSGRGFTVDVLVLDEAQHLNDDELEAIRSAVSSAPLGDPQVIYAGTPPNRERGQLGEVFIRIRAKAMKDKRLSWIEYGAPDGPLPDIDDDALLFECNPALELRHANGAYGLQMNTINDERGDLSPEGLARERFGWWGDTGDGASLVDFKEWANLTDKEVPIPQLATLVVDVAPGRAFASIGVASEAPNGRTLLMTTTKPGTDWVVAAVKKLCTERDIVEVALNPRGQAAVLIPELKKAHLEYVELTSADLGQACAAFQAGVVSKAWVHVGQPEIGAAIRNARTRMSGEAEVWDRRDARIDISPLVAASTAGHRWRTRPTKRSKYEETDLVVVGGAKP